MASENFTADPDKSRFDDFHRSRNRRSGNKPMPDWLKAALNEDTTASPNAFDDSEAYERHDEVIHHRRRNSSRLPWGAERRDRREFPLLNDSADESICYPSISQQQHHDNPQMIPNPQRRSLRRAKMPHRMLSRSGRKHSSGGGGGSGHHHRRNHSHARHHHHHSHHRHHSRNHTNSSGRVGGGGGGEMQQRNSSWRRSGRAMQGRYAGRKPTNGAHEDFLRQMMGNDELVNRERHGGDRSSTAADNKRLEDRISGSPVPNGMENPVMQKYFQDMK